MPPFTGFQMDGMCRLSCELSYGRRHMFHQLRPPADNLFTSIVANGEGWHNFHHAYPYDYATGEHDWWIQLNHSKMLIDFMWLIGQAYDCKRKVVKPHERLDENEYGPHHVKIE